MAADLVGALRTAAGAFLQHLVLQTAGQDLHTRLPGIRGQEFFAFLLHRIGDLGILGRLFSFQMGEIVLQDLSSLFQREDRLSTFQRVLQTRQKILVLQAADTRLHHAMGDIHAQGVTVLIHIFSQFGMQKYKHFSLDLQKNCSRPMFLHRFLMVLCAAGLLFPTPDALAQTDTLAAAAITGNGLRGVITPGQEAPAALLKGAADLGEVVRMFSGLQLKDYGGIGGMKTVNIRSLGSEYTGVYIDGIAVENAQNRQVDLGRFAPESFSGAEYYVGEQAGILLAAKEFCTAGSLYFYSMPIREDRIELRLRGGAFGMVSPSLAFQKCFRKGWCHRSEVQTTFAHGRYPFYWKQYDTTMTRENADIQALRLQSRLEKGKWKSTLYFYDSERGLPGAVIRRPKGQLLSADRQTDRDFFLQSIWKDENWCIRGKYSWRYTRYRTDPYRDPSAMPVDNRYLQHNAYLSAAWHHPVTRQWALETAADLEYDYLDANLPDFAYPHRLGSWIAVGNLFTFKHLRFSANLAWQGAADRVTTRTSGFSRQNDFRHFFSPSLVANTNIGPFTIDAFVRRVCRMPSFNDLYYTLVGNAALEPERALLSNLGIKWNSFPIRNLWVETSVRIFHNSVRDKIVAVPTTSSFRWSMYNIGRVEMTGADALAHLRYSWSHKRNYLDLRFTYTWQHPDKIVPYIPEHSISFAGDCRLGPWQFCLSVLSNAERYTTQTAFPEYRLSPFLTADARVRYTWREWTGGISLNNLTDSDYEYVKGYPMPGRHLLLSLQYGF